VYLLFHNVVYIVSNFLINDSFYFNHSKRLWHSGHDRYGPTEKTNSDHGDQRGSQRVKIIALCWRTMLQPYKNCSNNSVYGFTFLSTDSKVTNCLLWLYHHDAMQTSLASLWRERLQNTEYTMHSLITNGVSLQKTEQKRVEFAG